MNPRPLYFGPRDRRAFGWLHLPVQPRGLGLVLCPPLGYEAVQAHRALRHLAERLAQRGYAALRLDYHGTGDADGLDEDPARVATWIANIGDAATLLRESGCGAVGAYGLRAGALLCLASEARLDACVLHATPASGRAYVRELRALRAMMATPGDEEPFASADAKAEAVAGFLSTGATMNALGALDPKKLVARPCPAALLVARDDLAGDEGLARVLEELGVEVTRVTGGGYAAMMQDPHKTEVPSAAFASILDWLDTRPATRVAAHPLSADERLAPIAPLDIELGGVRKLDGPALVERPMRFGADHRLFAIVTETEASRPSGATVVLLNAGSVHRIGSNRMHVLWARAWAARGHRVVRMDIGGLGDSAAAPGANENQTYSTSAVSDVQALLAALPGEPVLLIGLCAGAYAAFHTARATQVTGALLINPQTFDWQEGDSLEIAAAKTISETRHYRRSLGSIEKWKKLLRGQVDVKHVAEVMLARGRAYAETRARNWARRFTDDDSAALGPLGLEIRRVATRTRLAFVYSEGDPGLDYLERHAGEAMRRFEQAGLVERVLIPRADHTFTAIGSQRQLFATLSAWIARS